MLFCCIFQCKSALLEFSPSLRKGRRNLLNISLEFSDDFLVCLVHLIDIDAGQINLRSVLRIMAKALADDMERYVVPARCACS